MEGKPYSAIFAFKWAGLDSLGNPQGYFNGEKTVNYTSISSSNNPDELAYMGTGTPTFFGGFRNSFNYKGLSLSFNLTYKLAYYFRRQNALSYSGLISGGFVYADFEKRWLNAGDENITEVPSFAYPANTNRDNFYTKAEVNVDKGDHIRLQDVQLSYAISKTKIRNLPVNGLVVYFYANNLGVLWKANKFNLDPDYLVGYPNSKTFSFGMNVNF